MLGSSLVLFVGAQLRALLARFGSARFFAGGNGRDAIVDRSAQLLAAGAGGGFGVAGGGEEGGGGVGCLDVGEAETKVGVGFVDGGADEGVPVVDADFGDVAGIVPDGDGVSDERRQSWGEVALALEVDAVALHDSGLRNSKEEPVKVFDALWHPGQPSVGDPRVTRRDSQLAMDSVVIGADEVTDRSIERCEVEDWRWCPAAGSEMTGEGAEQFGVDGAEEPLDLASPLGSADGRVDDPDVQGYRGPLEVVADEVGTVVHVQDMSSATADQASHQLRG